MQLKNLFKSRLRLEPGTRATSFLFIATSIAIAAGILIAANIYYNIDTGEIVMEEIQRVTQVIRATAGLIVGGANNQNPTAGFAFEVVGKSRLATTTITSAGQLEFQGSDTLAGFKAPSNYGTTTPMVYILPQHGNYPPQPDYVLTWQSGGQLLWKALSGVSGAGDITAVGDCLTGDCFTQTGGAGNNLWFITGGGGRIQLTGASTASNQTITLPPASGYVALGTSTAGYVAYWAGTNTLSGEQYLSTTRGGIGADSSGWSGMVRVVGGTWGPIQGTAGYAAYWSDANTVAAEQFLAVSRGGTGRGSWTQWGVLYADGTTSLNNTPAGSTYQILTANTGAAPTWRNIAELITATNGLTATGTTQLTLKLGGTLTENTTINLSNFNLLFNLTSNAPSEKFAVQVDGSDILVVNDSGQILYKTYPLAQTGKEVLREMVPIMGFDLPVKTTTTTAVQISRTIVSYPLNPCEPGSTRVHKLVVRYGSTGTSTLAVATSTTADFSSTTLPNTGDSSKGTVATAELSIPTPPGSCTTWSQGTDTTDWWVTIRLNQASTEIIIYQIFLAGYDKLL
jgi:hypothetical protein